MNIKQLLFIALSFSSVSLFASNETSNLPNSKEAESFTFSLTEDQQIDTKDWVRFPVEIAYDNNKIESVELLFPSQPRFVNSPLIDKPFVITEDSEGMIYKFSRMKINSNEYNLRQSFEFLIDVLSSDNKINAYAYTEPNPNDVRYFLSYVNKDGKQTMLTLVKSENFVYFFETSVVNDLYLNIDLIEIGDEAFKIMIHDSLKHGTFANSLKIGGGKSVK